jgi:hypothetical protein
LPVQNAAKLSPPTRKWSGTVQPFTWQVNTAENGRYQFLPSLLAAMEKVTTYLQSTFGIPKVGAAYANALKALHKRLSNLQLWWAIGGDLGEQLETVQVKPDCIEIVTNQEGANLIFSAVADLQPTPLQFLTQCVERGAVVGGIQYPVHMRSHYFEFQLEGVKIKVHGDLQYKMDNWEWGDKLEFAPEYIYFLGAKTALVPLRLKYEIYSNLGWADRADKIYRVLARRHRF